MLAQFKQQIQTQITPSQKLLIALSGGVDSVVLLNLLSKTHNKSHLRAIYIHHGLSQNADHWARFCQQICHAKNIPLIIKKVTIVATKNIESKARSARYQAIRETISQNEFLVTAHHLDDQAETFFLALKRGSGLNGLSAMQSLSHHHGFPILRPLLAFSKKDLTAYAIKHQLKWVEDESNRNTDFDRNFLRQEILPQLNQRWPHFSKMVNRSAKHCENLQLLLEELLNDELNKRADFALQSLEISGFKDFSKLKQQQLLRLWIEKSNVIMPSIAQLEQLIQFIDIPIDKNPQLKLGNKTIRRYQFSLFITDELSEIKPYSEKLSLNQTIILPENIAEISHLGDMIFCKFSQRSHRFSLPQPLINQPLEIKLNHGGKVKIYNKSHHEKMKKIWQQHQIPIWLRNHTPIVFFEDQFVMILK